RTCSVGASRRFPGIPEASERGNDMPGAMLPRGAEQALKTQFKGGFQKVVTDHERRTSIGISHHHLSVCGSANERLESLLDALLGSLVPTSLLEAEPETERRVGLGAGPGTL